MEYDGVSGHIAFDDTNGDAIRATAYIKVCDDVYKRQVQGQQGALPQLQLQGRDHLGVQNVHLVQAPVQKPPDHLVPDLPGPPHGGVPVSYTHLDVYKRQIDYYIFKNLDSLVSVWSKNTTEYSLSTTLSLPVLKEIIDSVSEEVIE